MKLFTLLSALTATTLVAAGRLEPATTTISSSVKPTHTPPVKTTTTHTWTKPIETETETETETNYKTYVKPSIKTYMETETETGTETETEYHTKHHHTKQTVVSVQSVYTPYSKPHHTDTVTVIGSKTYLVYIPTETPAVTAGASNGKKAAGVMMVLGGVAAFLL